jgi:hypothetical protein
VAEQVFASLVALTFVTALSLQQADFSFEAVLASPAWAAIAKAIKVMERISFFMLAVIITFQLFVQINSLKMQHKHVCFFSSQGWRKRAWIP